MKKCLISLFVILCALNCKIMAQEKSITFFDEIVFYDGYAKVGNQSLPENVIRHRNDLVAKKLSESDIKNLGNTLKLKVSIKAACDNYDRLGSINLAFVPKNDTTYIPEKEQRIELSRFITPFMNKNKMPDVVFFSFEIDNILDVLKDSNLNEKYDFWIEFEVFGVPYAAQKQVSGCEGRTDVFVGTLEFITNSKKLKTKDSYVLPLNFKDNLNNYSKEATDESGKTVRNITFNLPESLTNAKLYLITSNHGANEQGEEYNRRNHFIYFDENLKLTYKPGEETCEPYRELNTQGNGIYEKTPKTNEEWQSFSNWCPGAIIPTRVIELGNLNARQHTFKIDVPDAVFKEGQGYIPVSLYLQGKITKKKIK